MEWAERASRLFVTADTYATDLTPREQLIRALDLWESESWVRVLLALDEQDLRGLTLADARFSQAPLDHARRASEAVAEVLGEGTVVVGMVALGLGITASRCANETLQVLGESLGMPSMTSDDIDTLRNAVLGRLYFPEESSSVASEEPLVGTTERAIGIDNAAAAVSVVIRAAVAISLLIAAALSHDWILGVFALSALVATQPPQRDAEGMMSQTTRPGVVPIRDPMMLWVALLLALLNYPGYATVFAGTWLAIRLCTHVGEYAVGSGARLREGPEPTALQVFIRPANRWIVRRQAVATFIAAGAGVVTVLALMFMAPVSSALLLVGGLWSAIAVETSLGLWSTTSKRFRFGSALLFLFASQALHVPIDASAVFWPLLVVPPVSATIAMRIGLLYSRLHATPLVSRRAAGGKAEHGPWRQIAEGRSAQVLTDLSGAVGLSHSQRGALAIAHVLEGHPGQARNIVSALPPDVLPEAKHLVDAKAHALLGTKPGPWPEGVSLDTELGLAARRAWLQASLPFEDPIEMALAVDALIPQTINRRNALAAMDTYLTLGEAFLPVNQSAGALAVSRTFGLAQIHCDEELERLGVDEFDGTLISRPALHILLVRSAAFTLLWSAEEGHASVGDLLDEEALTALTSLTNPYEVARYCNRGADLQRRQQGRVTGDGLELRIQAFASVNVVRHRLTDPDDRALWWVTFARTLDTLLDEAWRYQDWQLLLEAIEAARLQLGTSREDLRPTALAVTGASKIANQRFAYGDRPTTQALEEIIDVAGGSNAWWWATHVSGGRLYWSVSGPGVAVQGGRIDASEFNPVLEDLDVHLATRRADESQEDWARRLYRSALFRAPSEFESRLAGRVGALLPQVVRSAVETSTVRATICMSLAPEIAHIPWAWVRVGQRRLVEAFDTVIVPPASLVPGADTDVDKACPVALAVINPGNDLEAAEQTRDLLPVDVRIVDAATTAPIRQLGALLRTAPYDSTLFLACHTDVMDGHRGFVFAPLDEFGREDVLFAKDIARQDTAHPMPRQVIALACSIADLSSASAGEWTVLGTSLIQAGARRALVTAYPIFSLAEVDRTVLAGTQSGEPLHVTLARLQLGMLDRWRLRDASAAPLRWAGLQLFGTLAIGRGQGAPSTPRWVGTSFLKALDAAARWAPKGAVEVGPLELMRYFAVYGYIEDLPRPVRARVRRRFLSLLPPPLSYGSMWLRYRGADDAQPRAISADLWAIIDDAERLATEMGRPVVDSDHLFVAALRGAHPACVEMRAITGMDTRNPAVLHSFLSNERGIMFDTGEVKVDYLMPGDVERVYALFGVTPPIGEDRWWYNERLS